jgi:hypothetical protein
VPNLDLVMTGDCISAVTALGNTERAVRSLQSRAGSGVGVAVSVGGARAAAKDLGAVSAAIGSTHAAAAGLNRTPIAGGMVAGAAAARGLSSSLSGTNRAMGEARAGAGALVVASTGATRSMGGMIPVVAGMTSRLGAMGRAASGVAALPAAIPGGRGGVGMIAAASAATGRLQSSLAAQQLQAARGLPVMAAANAQTAALAGNATAAAGAMTRLGGAPIPVRSLGYLGNLREGLREGMLQGLGGDAEPERGTGRPPPPVPVPPRGGGGGGGADDAERRGAAAGKQFAEIGKGIGTLLMAGMAVGIATNASYTKHAMDAINATISETPDLAEKAKDAADELGKGIAEITKGVDVGKYEDSFDALGRANKGLGKIQGQIGLDNLATKLQTETQMANATANAYIRMAPAFDAAIRGSNNLGVALLDGISNPQVVNGVRSFSEAIAKPEIAKGLADLTTGATSSMLVFGKIVADVSGAASKALNGLFGDQNVTDASGAVFGGGAIAALAKGGLMSKLGAGILGGSTVYGSQKLMAEGRDDEVLPSVINQALGSMLGYRVGGVAGMVAGGLLAQWGTIKAGEAGPKSMLGQVGSNAISGLTAGLLAGSVAGPVGAAVGGTAGLVAGTVKSANDSKDPDFWNRPLWGPGSDSRLPLSATPPPGPDASLGERFTYAIGGGGPSTPAWEALQAKDAKTQAAQAGATTGGVDPQSRMHSRQLETQQRANAAADARGAAQPYPGAGTPGATPAASATAMSSRQQATQQRVNAAADSRGAPLPYPGVNAPATAAPAAMRSLDQSAQQAQRSVQSLGQSMPQVAQQVQAVPAAMAPIQQMPQQAATQMKTAASIIQNSAQEVGSSIPPAVSTGIVKQTPKVCDAAADMGANMVNCTASALRSASPSKKFIALGESTGDGAAIGVNNSAGGAVDAVGSMAGGMLAAVGALGSGVEAASEGAVPIAESGGLMVGYVWARSVATGVDSVLKSADFAQASMPAINSALAKTTLGKLGLLGVAGSGASISKSANGGMISMPAPQVNATIMVSVDGTPLKVLAQQVMDAGFGELADSMSRQRG